MDLSYARLKIEICVKIYGREIRENKSSSYAVSRIEPLFMLECRKQSEIRVAVYIQHEFSERLTILLFFLGK